MITGRLSHADRLTELRTSEDATRAAVAKASIAPPESLIRTLARWRLLEAVPFQYLAADEDMLPPEAIRFFQIDNLWIDCLIDGAFSIGRATSADHLLDKVTVPSHAASGATGSSVRRASLVGGEVAAAAVPAAPGAASGFLLRSGAVSGWPGIEVEAQDSSGVALPILRLAHLSEDVLFGVFVGQIDQLVIHPPSEGLHFGFPDDADGPKTLRFTAPAGSHSAGDPAPASVQPAFRDQSTAARVLNVAQLKKDIQKGLGDAGDTNPNFTAAEFALEMTTGVDQVVFAFPSQ